MAADVKVAQGYASIVKWCPDLVRDECRNIGVILIDAEGTAGGIRHLSTSFLPESVRKGGIVPDLLGGLHLRFDKGERPTLSELETMSNNLRSHIRITPPKPIAVLEDNWFATLSDLWDAYAKPPPRPNTSIVVTLARSLRPFIDSKKITRDHEFETSSSGVPWTVDFVVEGMHLAVDGINLALKKPDAILTRAAAEAYKLSDILSVNSLDAMVCCNTSSEPAVERATRDAIRLIEREGAEVIPNPSEAVDLLRQRLGDLQLDLN
jgi:hypothetical protein